MHHAMNPLLPALILYCSTSVASSSTFAEVAKGGRAELLLGRTSLKSYFDGAGQEDEQTKKLRLMAEECRRSYLESGIAHIPDFVRKEVVQEMVQEATLLRDQGHSYRSSDQHTIYQEPQTKIFPPSHPRNALQLSKKWIIDFSVIVSERSSSPLRVLYLSPELRAFVAFVVRPSNNQEEELFESGCDYNAAYYNIYGAGDGLGWHFDRSEFGLAVELQCAQQGGDFELCWNTRSSATSMDDSSFQAVQSILAESSQTECPSAQRIRNPPVGPGSLVFFAGCRNLHRVTPVGEASSKPRINAIMTYETKPNQRPNAYSLRKFFGR